MTQRSQQNESQLNGQELRHEYRSLLEDVAEKEEFLSTQPQDMAFPVVKKFISKADQLFVNVATAQNCILDAKIVHQLSGMCRHQAQTLSVNTQNFNATEFAVKIVQCMGGTINESTGRGEVSAEKWKKLGIGTKVLFNRSPFLTYLNGTLDKEQRFETEVKRSRAKQTNNNNNSTQITESTFLKSAEKSENQTEVLVESTWKQLIKAYRNAGRRPVNFFEFSLDPTSFGNSVENLFHIAFLIKEDRAAILLNDELEYPLIHPVSVKRNEDNDGEIRPKKIQTVINLEVSQWKALVRGLNIQEPMIKHSEDQIDYKKRR